MPFPVGQRYRRTVPCRLSDRFALVKFSTEPSTPAFTAWEPRVRNSAVRMPNSFAMRSCARPASEHGAGFGVQSSALVSTARTSFARSPPYVMREYRHQGITWKKPLPSAESWVS